MLLSSWQLHNYCTNHHHKSSPSSLQTTNLKLEKYLNLAILEEDFWTIVYFAKHVLWYVLKMAIAKDTYVFRFVMANWFQLIRIIFFPSLMLHQILKNVEGNILIFTTTIYFKVFLALYYLCQCWKLWF